MIAHDTVSYELNWKNNNVYLEKGAFDYDTVVLTFFLVWGLFPKYIVISVYVTRNHSIRI